MKNTKWIIPFVFMMPAMLFANSQQNKRVVIVSSQAKFNYLRKQTDGPGSVILPVAVKVKYNGILDSNDANLTFALANSASASAINPGIISGATPTIPHLKFTLAEKDTTFIINVKIDAVDSLPLDVFFDIVLKDSASGAPYQRVVIQNKSLNEASAQVKITLYNSNQSIAPLVADAPSKDSRTFYLKYSVEGDLENDSTIAIAVKTNDGNSISPVLSKTTVTIPAHKKGTDSVPVYFDINSVKTFGKDEKAYITAGDARVGEITFTRKQMQFPNKPFWIEIGSNFDFIDGLQPSNLFSGVFFHKRDVRKVTFYQTKSDGCFIKKKSDATQADAKTNTALPAQQLGYKPEPNNLAIFAGVYESKSISSQDDVKGFERIYYDKSLSPVRNDSVGLLRDTGTIKNIQVVRNISLFFSPQLRLTNGSANADGLHIFLSLWSELQWQKITSETDYSQLVRQDTPRFVPKNQANFYTSNGTRTTVDIKTHYLGLGLPFYFREGDVNLYANPVIGWSTQQRDNELQNYFQKVNTNSQVSDLQRTWRPFYLFQFRLSEESYGFAFTGEVRGLIMKNSPPLISLSLTKKFDLTKFLEFK